MKKIVVRNFVSQAWRVRIRDKADYDPNSFDVNNSLLHDEFSYALGYGPKLAHKLDVSATYVGANPIGTMEYNWDINDAQLSGQQNSISFNIVNDQSISVCLSAIDINQGCWLLNCGEFNPFGKAECLLNLEAFEQPSGTVNIIAHGTGNGDLVYSFQGSAFGKDNTYSFSPDQSTSILVEVRDNQDHRALASVCVITGLDSLLISTLDMNYEFSGVQNNVKRLKEVTLVYTDENDVEYSSARIEQGPEQYFEILQLENYLKNDIGYSTKKVDLAFDVKLANHQSETIHIREGQATIAIAYPD